MKIYLNPGPNAIWHVCHHWQMFSKQFMWLQQLLNTTFEQTDDPSKCDLAFTECSSPQIVPNKMNIVLCGECDARWYYTQFMRSAEGKGNIKFLGTICDSDISFNCQLLHIRQNPSLDPWTLESFSAPNFSTRKPEICFMRHAPTAKLREFVAKLLHVKLVNAPDKLKMISSYVMNFCAENSFSAYNGTDGYITEKLYDAAAAGCIPVYYGGSLAYTILNPTRVLTVRTSQFDVLKDALRIRRMSCSQLQHIFQLPILRPDYKEFVAYRKSRLLKFLGA